VKRKKWGNTFPLIFDVVKILEHNAAPPVVVEREIDVYWYSI
jgi:hypothetical protein